MTGHCLILHMQPGHLLKVTKQVSHQMSAWSTAFKGTPPAAPGEGAKAAELSRATGFLTVAQVLIPLSRAASLRIQEPGCGEKACVCDTAENWHMEQGHPRDRELSPPHDMTPSLSVVFTDHHFALRH